jgi:hypothetical protein
MRSATSPALAGQRRNGLKVRKFLSTMGLNSRYCHGTACCGVFHFFTLVPKLLKKNVLGAR